MRNIYRSLLLVIARAPLVHRVQPIQLGRDSTTQLPIRPSFQGACRPVEKIDHTRQTAVNTAPVRRVGICQSGVFDYPPSVASWSLSSSQARLKSSLERDSQLLCFLMVRVRLSFWIGGGRDLTYDPTKQTSPFPSHSTKRWSL